MILWVHVAASDENKTNREKIVKKNRWFGRETIDIDEKSKVKSRALQRNSAKKHQKVKRIEIHPLGWPIIPIEMRYTKSDHANRQTVDYFSILCE